MFRLMFRLLLSPNMLAGVSNNSCDRLDGAVNGAYKLGNVSTLPLVVAS